MDTKRDKINLEKIFKMKKFYNEKNSYCGGWDLSAIIYLKDV